MTRIARHLSTLCLLSPLFLLSLLAGPAWSQDDLPQVGDLPEVIDGATEYMVAMRDGVRLATNVFAPEGEGPWPVVVTRTPYGKDGGMSRQWRRYTAGGYVYVVQDVRGQFRSEGEYRPFETDREDGYDTVEWVARQNFSNGKVGMSGASAMGITTNYAAATAPPHLVAGFVVVAPHSMLYESTFIGGVFKDADVGNWMRRQGAGDQVAERKAGVYLNDYWRQRDLPFFLDNIRIPIYNVGGWYDIFSQGNISNFRYLQEKGAEGARGNQKLLMGPFGHGQLTGELEYPNGSNLMTVFGDELRWFDYWLKGIDNGIMDEPAVRYYRMAHARKGEVSPHNDYRNLQHWPPPSRETKYFLTGAGQLSTTRPPADVAPSSYSFDPDNPVPTFGGANLTLPLGPQDQRSINGRSDYLRFQTETLQAPVEVAGRIRAELWISSDAVDTDFTAKLVDVYPDGYEALLLDAPLRTRFRNGQRREDVAFLKPGEPVQIEIDLWSTANLFEVGHRIALHVSSSNAPRFEVNRNNGEEPGLSEKAAKVARNSIYHDAARPSALVLPVLAPQPVSAATSSRE